MQRVDHQLLTSNASSFVWDHYMQQWHVLEPVWIAEIKTIYNHSQIACFILSLVCFIAKKSM